MVLVIFGSFLRIPARFHWTVQSDAFFVVVAMGGMVVLLALYAYAWLPFLVLLVRP